MATIRNLISPWVLALMGTLVCPLLGLAALGTTSSMTMTAPGNIGDRTVVAATIRFGETCLEESVASDRMQTLFGLSHLLNAPTRVATPSGEFYSSAYQTTLRPTSYPGVSRGRHFQEANENLLHAMEADAGFAQVIQESGVTLQRTATGLAPRTPPPGWTWHHAPESGVMELVPRVQHAPGSIFQGTLHPGGQGGFSIWGQ